MRKIALGALRIIGFASRIVVILYYFKKSYIFFTQTEICTKQFLSYLLHKASWFHRHHKSFQQLWRSYLATGSVADLAQRPERRVITALQDIHIKLSYIWRRFVTARNMSQTIFGINGRHIPASSTSIQKRGHAIHAKQFTSATRAVL